MQHATQFIQRRLIANLLDKSIDPKCVTHGTTNIVLRKFPFRGTNMEFQKIAKKSLMETRRQRQLSHGSSLALRCDVSTLSGSVGLLFTIFLKYDIAVSRFQESSVRSVVAVIVPNWIRNFDWQIFRCNATVTKPIDSFVNHQQTID